MKSAGLPGGALIKIGSNSVFSTGFTSIIALVMYLMYTWVDCVQHNRMRLDHIAGQYMGATMNAEIRDASYQRVLTLERMVAMTDPRERNEALTYLGELDSTLHMHRDMIFSGALSVDEHSAWTRAFELLAENERVQGQLLGLISESRLAEAESYLRNTVIPAQSRFIRAVGITDQAQHATMNHEMAAAEEEITSMYWMIGLLGGLAVSFGALMLSITKRVGKAQDEVAQQGKRIRALYEVSSTTGMTLDAQLHAVLEAGCELFGMEIGQVRKTNTADRTSELVHVVAPDDLTGKSGEVQPLDQSLCSVAIAQREPLAIHDISTIKSPNLNTDVRAYLGVPLTVNGQCFGTLSFSSPRARSAEFSATDKDLLCLIGNWVSVALERKSEQAELHSTMELAEQASKTKSIFLASISHELRTPLNAIIGYSELLADIARDDGSDTKYGDLNKITSAGRHLLNLINEILDLSKIEAGRMELSIEPCDVREVTQEIVTTFEPTLHTNNNRFNLNIAAGVPRVMADMTRLKQVLLNLLGNAHKFTRNGEVSLTITADHIGNARFVRFTVRDTGLGMTAEQLASLFQAFTQAAPGISRQFGGTGLGLAISKRFCNMMGGDISATSTEGTGSTFTAIIPAAVAVQRRVAA